MSETTPGSPLAPSLRPRLAAKARLREDRIDGGMVLLYPEGVLKLNPAAAAILELCDGRRDLDEVAAALAERFQAPREVLVGDLREFVGRLHDRGLLLLQASEEKAP